MANLDVDMNLTYMYWVLRYPGSVSVFKRKSEASQVTISEVSSFTMGALWVLGRPSDCFRPGGTDLHLASCM